MAGISSLGIGSGLDSNALVDRLVAAERAGPERRFNRAEARLSAELSAFGMLQSRLDDLESALEALDGLASRRRASVSDSSILAATASDDADPASYRIEVQTLARAHSVASSGYTDTSTPVGSGTLNISVGGADPVAVDIDPAADTLADVRDAINDADAGVQAAIIDDGSGNRLVLTADATGAANTIDVSVTDDDGNHTDTSGLSALSYTSGARNLDEMEAATDAALAVNGLAVTRASNSIDDLLPGVTLELARAEPGTEVEVRIETDTGAARAAVEDFVEAYNALQKQIDRATDYNADTGRAGILLGDSTTRSLMSALRNGVVRDVDTSGSLDHLVDLGVTTGEGGGLEIDDAVLDEALEGDFAGVAELLAGVGESFAGTVGRFGGDDGLVASRSDGLEARLDDIGDQREALERRIAQVEARYRSEFAALDTLISRLQSTGDFLARQLANLPGAGNSPD